MKTLGILTKKFTLCDSGEPLNWLMHPFLFLTLVLSIAFLFFGHTESVQAMVLYQQSLSNGAAAVNVWGIIGLVTMTIHSLAFIIRGKIGIHLMPFSIFGGAYLWVYAAVVYLSAGFIFQFLTFCLPNLFFWAWYTLEWRKRRRGDRVAFV